MKAGSEAIKLLCNCSPVLLLHAKSAQGEVIEICKSVEDSEAQSMSLMQICVTSDHNQKA